MSKKRVLKVLADGVSELLEWADEVGIALEYVEDSVQIERYQICQECPDKQFDSREKRCLVCLCKMPTKTKLKSNPVTGKETKCPNGHW